jgi:hypothetical protein
MPTFHSPPIVKLRMAAWPKGYDVEKTPGLEERWQLIRMADRVPGVAPNGGPAFTTEEAKSFLAALPARAPGRKT